MTTLTVLSAASLVVAFLALSFLGWDRKLSHHQIFGSIALFMVIGLLAKWVPILGIVGFGAITWMSVVRFVGNKRSMTAMA